MRVRPYLPVSAVGHRHEGAIARGAMYTAFSIVLFEFTLVIQYAIIRTEVHTVCMSQGIPYGCTAWYGVLKIYLYSVKTEYR